MSGLYCVPGDIARVIKRANNGETPPLVEVMYEQPRGSYTLPDGYPADSYGTRVGDHHWICRALGEPFTAPTNGIKQRACFYASIPDRVLRPIRPGEEPESTEESTSLPAPEVMA